MDDIIKDIDLFQNYNHHIQKVGEIKSSNRTDDKKRET